MKKKVTLSLLAALYGISMQAQPQPQYLYGTPGNEVLTDGHNTAFGTGGHVLAAPSAIQAFAFSLTRTDPAGIVKPAGYPYFSNVYQVSDVSYASGGAPNLAVGSVAFTEYGGDMYLVAGSYLNGAYMNGMGVFFQKIGDDGVLAPYLSPDVNVGYYPDDPGGLYKDVQVKRIINSSLVPGDRYILGTLAFAANGARRPFILKINTTGALQWSHIYEIGKYYLWEDVPSDIVEADGKNGPELLVVGEHFIQGNPHPDAFLMPVDCNSGATSSCLLYGKPGIDEGFSSIKISTNSNLDPQGAFILGGYAAGSGSRDFWFLALDHDKNIISSRLFDYNVNSGNTDYCTDVLEQTLISGDHNYYLAGYTDNGVFGQEDMVLIRTDQAGNGLPAGQATYGTPDNQRALRLDMDDNGLALYGTSTHHPQPSLPMGGSDLYLVKADFGGVSDCNYQLAATSSLEGPDLVTVEKTYYSGEFIPTRIYTRKIDELDELDACHICDALKSPLVAHWSFKGGNLSDDVLGLTGVINGGVTPATSLLGGPDAYRFDGVSGFIQVPYNPVMNLQSWTLAALVKPEGFYSGTCQANRIITRGDELGPNFYTMELGDNAFDADCYVYSPFNEVVGGGAAGVGPFMTAPLPSPPTFINLNQWYCIWISYDAAAGRIDFYKDAVLQVSMPWSNQYGLPSTDDLFIGSNSDPAGYYPYFFNGVIDDIAIYGGPLICPLNCSDAMMGTASKKIQLPQAVSGDDISVSPNPTTGNVALLTPVTWSGGDLTVLNATGQTVSRIKVDATGKTRVDLSSQAAGIYLLRIEKNGQYTVKKVIRH